ncbi:D-3-phosphoglycerate dehydrogenase, chloroplastic [Tetrabaena socialis]|uniref:D-3-phosphoglycerate dehydrogenase, chloroplastic n=1 Tax=Tetrabaena socialis TaxID=47790 RepID=A0A2J8A8W5_9CHLO|nr:D-3-phosphoglycerate dehydrogenase, chloroplastic [Tetrabaena socialis]|eukprot:PNH08967.1 D-3-phosphoglycerate dehydrogenase, chloroplastic [Tetrabaena socialis]
MQQSLGNRPCAARRAAAARIGRQRCVKVSAVASGKSKPTVLVAEKLGEAGIEMLRQTCNVETAYTMKPEDLCAKVSLVDALIVRSATKVTRAVFEASNGRLKVVGRAGVGVDNVDLAAATEYGCLVVNAPTANTVAAAEHGIALLCAMARNVAQVNISFMTVSRTAKDGEAIMAIGIDSEPSAAVMAEITSVPGVVECTIFKEVSPAAN